MHATASRHATRPIERNVVSAGRRAALAALLAAPAIARAQTRIVRLVLGFPPGGSADFLGRAMAERLGQGLGATIVIDNRPGAGSNIATEYVAHADPDGTTLLLGGNFSHAVNPVMYRRVGFDPVADFTPIGRVCDLPTIIAVSAASGITSLAELLARMRAKPGAWNYGTPGIGTPSHLAGAMFSRVTGLEWTHVPFRGGAPSLTALLSRRYRGDHRHAPGGAAADARREGCRALAHHRQRVTGHRRRAGRGGSGAARVGYRRLVRALGPGAHADGHPRPLLRGARLRIERPRRAGAASPARACAPGRATARRITPASSPGKFPSGRRS